MKITTKAEQSIFSPEPKMTKEQKDEDKYFSPH